MDKCQICGKPNNHKITIIISTLFSLDVCSDCLNDYANHNYNKLMEKIDKNPEIKTSVIQ
jgi:ribosome-binding protein aMBF1 (putative translation factor)